MDVLVLIYKSLASFAFFSAIFALLVLLCALLCIFTLPIIWILAAVCQGINQAFVVPIINLSSKRPSTEPLRRAVDLIWFRKLRTKCIKCITEDRIEIANLLSQGRHKAAAWRTVGTYAVVSMYVFTQPLVWILGIVTAYFRKFLGAGE
jgi:ABC-type glycerol-3-phosphate transport system permease component